MCIQLQGQETKPSVAQDSWTLYSVGSTDSKLFPAEKEDEKEDEVDAGVCGLEKHVVIQEIRCRTSRPKCR